MTATHHAGPLVVGPRQTGDTLGANQGYAILCQTANLTQNSTTAVSATLYVPTGCRITNILVDVLTAFNSVTSATLSVGTAAAGTQYASGVDCKTATGRITPTFTAAQLAAMSGQSVLGVAAAIASPGTVVITITPVGATSAGYVTVAVFYEQLI